MLSILRSGCCVVNISTGKALGSEALNFTYPTCILALPNGQRCWNRATFVGLADQKNPVCVEC